MTWVKLTPMLSYGDEKPHYMYCPDGEEDESIENMKAEVAEEYSWSEHWRRCIHKIIATPPEEWIDQEIDNVSASIECEQEYLAILKALR